MLALVALPTSPFWARRYTRSFLASCHGMNDSTAETAELLVSEIVTNAVRFSGDPARTLQYSERADAGLISLSLRQFREGLLIEVYDTDKDPPIRSHADEDAENGRGLMLVDARHRHKRIIRAAPSTTAVFRYGMIWRRLAVCWTMLISPRGSRG